MLNLENYRNAFKWLINLKGDVLKVKSLEYTVIVALSIALVFGFVVFLIDPNVHSLGDGIWYAWVSMTHVGYGDVVPSSLLGRLLGAVLILAGLGMFALFTASFSAVLIGRDFDNTRKDELVVRENEESLVLQELARLHQRLDQLEERLSNKQPDK